MSKVKTISFNPPSFLSKSKLESLNRLLETTRSVQSLQLASAVGLQGGQALVLMDILAERLNKEKTLAIYHFCEDADCPLRVEDRPFGEGFPKVPYRCPNCCEDVSELAGLSFDFALDLSEVIELREGED